MEMPSSKNQSVTTAAQSMQSANAKSRVETYEPVDVPSWARGVEIKRSVPLIGQPTWEPTTFGINDKFLYCNVGSKKLEAKANLESNEIKIVQATLKDHALEQIGKQIGPDFKPFSTFGKSRFLVEDTLEARQGLENAKCSAVIITWKGNGEPPKKFTSEKWPTKLAHCLKSSAATDSALGDRLNDNAKFKKAWRDPSHNGGRKWRWVKVELYRPNDSLEPRIKEYEKELRREFPYSIDLDCVPMSVNIENVSVRKLFTMDSATRADITNNFMWKEFTNALLAKEFNGRPEIAVHAHRFFTVKQSSGDNVVGLRLCKGKEYHIGGRPVADGSTKLVLYSAPLVKLFFKPGGTVAEFFLQRWPSTRTEELDKMLRGKKVRFHNGVEMEERTICQVAPKTAENTPEDEKHDYWRGQIGLTFSHANLPCINVGTSWKHEYMPASLCYLVNAPQTYTGPRFGISMNVDGGRNDDIHRSVREGQAAFALSVNKPANKILRKVKLDTLINEAFQSKTKVGFIEAGVESRDSSEWKGLRQKLDEILNGKDIQVAGKLSVKEMKPLFLQYSDNKDKMNEWTDQLQAWKKLHRVKGEKILAVVLLNDDKHHSAIYKLLKGLGDSRLGIQTYFLKTKLLKEKGLKDVSMDTAAREVIHRMAYRNVSPLRVSGDRLDIAIAVHVEPIMVDVEESTNENTGKTKVKQERKHLIVLSSRHVGDSRDYKTTESRLFGDSDFKDGTSHIDVLNAELQQFVKDVQPNESGSRVTLLRTGYLFDDAQDEATSFSEVIRQALGKPSEVSYILLIDQDISQVSAQEQELIPPEKSSMLLTNVRKAGKVRVARLYRRTNMKWKSDSDALNPVSTFDTYFLGDEFPTELQTVVGKNSGSPIEPRAMPDSLTLDTTNHNPDRDSGYGTREPSIKGTSPTGSNHAALIHPAGPIHDAEMKRLAALWRDEGLKLYDTKFPIPSHLAHAAAKRAKTHITERRWNYLDGDYDPPTLNPVHSDVKDTLYFL